MRNIFVALVGLLLHIYCCAQVSVTKRPLEIKDFANWPEIGNNYNINSTGKFVYYFLETELPGSKVLHVKAIDNSWSTKINGAVDARFSIYSSSLLVLLPDNMLLLLNLGSGKPDTLTNVSEYSLFELKGKEFLKFKKDNSFVIRELKTTKETTFEDAASFTLSNNNLLAAVLFNDGVRQRLDILDLQIMRTTTVHHSKQITDIRFSKDSKKLAFIAIGDSVKSIWTYSKSDPASIKLLDEQDLNLGPKYKLTSLTEFVAGDQNLRFVFSEVRAKEPLVNASGVNVYSYTDEMAYDLQRNKPLLFKGVGILNIQRRVVVYCQQPDESISMLNNDNWAKLRRISPSGYMEPTTIQLLSVLTGKRQVLEKGIFGNNAISPDGKYLLLEDNIGYLDRGKIPNHLYSYEIKTGTLRNLTSALPIPLFDMEFKSKAYRRIFSWLAWNGDNGKVWVRDNYDIWEIDLSSKIPARNLTNGYGRSNRIIFDLSESVINLFDKTISPKSIPNIILRSYNYRTAENDLYSICINKAVNPRRLTKGKCLYESLLNGQLGGGSVRKARHKYVFILGMQDASRSFNLFTTNDFTHFNSISNNYPEKKYNWVNAELHSFNTSSGGSVLGTLYKPEDFDSTKKYPVIFYIYQRLSENTYRYIKPELSSAVINIPYYVSNGYLVFTPDVEADLNNEGKSADSLLAIVESAADYLSGKAWVNASKMAIHGHSWGGFECNYIVTHSSRFAAAFTGAGHSDAFADYGMPSHGGLFSFNTMSYINLGSPPFSAASLYFNNSPKFAAEKVTTPLLMMHNKGDEAVLFPQGLSFFYTLRNLKKKVWLLEYDGEGHTIQKQVNQIDYTIRVKQFFDHYLKGAPAPVWMTRGVPYKLKGIEDGLEMDMQVKTPPTLTILQKQP